MTPAPNQQLLNYQRTSHDDTVQLESGNPMDQKVGHQLHLIKKKNKEKKERQLM